MHARIFQPAQNAMQSGGAKSKSWVLEFAPETSQEIDPLMGWSSSSDTQRQVQIRFDDQNSAEKYAREHGLDYLVMQSHHRQKIVRRGGYGDNFSTNRRSIWTH